MNIIIKRFFAFILSFALIFSSTSALAASPVGWSASPADIIMNGASATINAVKGSGSSALQSTIKHAPTAGRVAKNIVKVGGVGAVAMAITQTLGDGVDWVLDPANNRVKYFPQAPAGDPSAQYTYSSTFGTSGNRVTKEFSNPDAACQWWYVQPGNTWYKAGMTIYSRVSSGNIYCTRSDGANVTLVQKIPNPAYDPTAQPEPAYLPFSTVATKIISNAATGEPSSQEMLKTVAIEDLDSGALDVPLNTAAVPKADAPAVPDPNAPPIDPDAPVPPFDPSSIISAIKSVMAAVVNMSGVLGAKIDSLMVEMGLQNAETNRVINDGMADVVAANNATGARVGDVVAAIEALEGNTLDGQVINDAVDRVIAEGKTNTSDIVAAIEAIEGNTLDGQVINDAIDRVIANDNINAQAAADAATAAADAAKAADAANTAAVTDAIDKAALEAKEAADAKAAADAEFQDWVKEEAPPLDDDTALDIPDNTVLPVDTDINFGGSCPANFEVNSSIFGNPINITLFETSKFCSFLSTFVKFPVYAASSLFALYILGGRKDV